MDAADHFKRALAKFRSRDVKDALVDLEEAIRLDPSRWEYFWTRGAFHYRRRALTMAEADLTTAIQLCTDVKQVGKVYQRRMFCYGRMEQYDAVVRDATWLIDHGFADEGVHTWRGWAYFKLSEFDRAIADYSYVDPSGAAEHPFRKVDRAMVYYWAKRYNEALQELNTALVLFAHKHDFLFMLYQMRSLTLYRLGDIAASLVDSNLVQELIGGFEKSVNVVSYAHDMKAHNDRYFSDMPSRPYDGYTLKKLK